MDGQTPPATLTAADIVKEVKWNGYFDQFRKDCLADKSSQPLFNNLEKLVQDLVQKYLGEQTWNSQLKRADIRDKVIKRLNENYHVTNAVNSITDSVVSSKIELSFRPIIDKIVENWENNLNNNNNMTAPGAASSQAPSSEAKQPTRPSTSSGSAVKVEDFLAVKENIIGQAKPAAAPATEPKALKKPMPTAKEPGKPGGTPAATPGASKLPVKTNPTGTPAPAKPAVSVKTEPPKSGLPKPANGASKPAPTDLAAKKVVKPPVKGSTTPAAAAVKPAISAKPASSAKPPPSTGKAAKPLFEPEAKFVLEPDPSKEYNYNWRLDWKPAEGEASLLDDISVSSVSDSDLTDYEIIREIEAMSPEDDQKAPAKSEPDQPAPS